MSKILLTIIFLICCLNLSAQLDLSLTQSEANCSSDGSITAAASDGTTPYQYQIVSGPELRGFQVTGMFNALQPGAYVVEVRDATFATFSETITVTGSYVLPSLNNTITLPTCSNSSNGQVILTGEDGNLIGTSAFPTYKYRIVDLSSFPQTVILEQNSGTFSGLSEGTYTFQIEDGCQNTVSEAITLTAPSIVSLSGAIDFIEKVTCNTYEAEYTPFGRGASPHDVTVTEDATGNVIFSGSIDTSSGLAYSLGTNYDFGVAYTVDVVDACGQTDRLDFDFTPDIEIIEQKALDCSGDTAFFVYPSLTSSSAENITVLVPATLTLTNQADASDVIVYTLRDKNDLRVEINQADIVVGGTYDVSLVDSCNAIINETYTFTPLPPAQFSADVRPERGCMDGTTGMTFLTRDGKSDFIRATIISGPASFTSEGGVVTNYNYPRIFERTENSVFPVGFPPGNYEVEITDGCESGNVSFEILASETVEHDFTLDFVQSCGNSNSLIINPNVIKDMGTSFYTNVRVNNLDTGDTVFRESRFFFTEGVPVTVPNLPPGNYQLNLEFQSGGNCSSTNTLTCPCEAQTVNVTIPVYDPTAFQSIVGFTCTEGSGVIFAEGLNGVEPYAYEIIASSVPVNIGRTSTDGIFTMTDEGTYTVRISDSCGNSADGAFEVTPYLPDLVANCDPTGTQVTLSANPVPTAIFTWTDASGTIVQQGESNELIFNPFDSSLGGEYTLQVAAPSLSCTIFENSITVPSNPCNSSIDAAKTIESGPTFNSVTDEYTVTYRITAENSGGLAGTYDIVDTFILGTGFTLTNATLAYGGESDGVDGTILTPFISGDQIITNESLAGLRTESWLVTATFTVDIDLFDPTQDCTNGGGFGNQITVIGDTDPTNDTACIPVEIGGIQITKDGSYVDANTNGLTNIGDTVIYTFVVTNTGNVAISNVVVSDPLLGGAISGPASGDTNGNGELDLTETWTYTGSYSITQTDIDNGQVNNLATVTGEDNNGNPITDTSIDPTPCVTCTPDPAACADCTLTELPNTLDISLTKTVDVNTAEIGEELFFIITATNNGSVSASNILISEVLPNGFSYIDHVTTMGAYDETSGAWNIAALSSGQTAELRIRTLVVEGTDYRNIARLIGVDQTDSDPSNDEASVEVGIRGINITKDGTYSDLNSDGITNEGDVVAYTFVVTNTGNFSLSTVVVSDPLLGGVIPGLDSGDTDGDGELDPTEIWTYSANYNLNQTDIDNGQVSNLATVTGEDPEGRTSTDTSTDPTPCTTCTPDPTCTDCTLTELPSSIVDIALTKIADVGSARVGDEINFTITASNIGTVTTSNISISEELPNGFDYISHLTTLSTYDDTTALWNIDALSVGQVAELQIRVLVVEGSNYLNIVNLMGLDQIDMNPLNDEAQVEVEIDEPLCAIEVFNVFTPNKDNVNDFFQIACIENYPNNNVQVFNRWGVKVFEQDQYNNTWGGTSEARTTLSRGQNLPVGTYFYILDLGDGTQNRTGWVYIN